MGKLENEINGGMKLERESLSYRQGVIGIVIDDNKKFLLVQMKRYEENQWRFPGGGINENETPEEALIRELEEELGSPKFGIKKKSQYISQYEWPDEVIERRLLEHGQTWRGQQQQQFLVRFTGTQDDLKPNLNELRQIKWVNFEQLSE